MFNISDISRDAMMLSGGFSQKGYDWWWHSFTAHEVKTGKEKQFFIEYFLCNPDLGQDYPVFGQLPANKKNGIRPSYMMVKAGCWGPDHKQIHRFFGWNQVDRHDSAPFRIQAGSCYVSDDRLMGHVNVSEDAASAHPEYMSDAGNMYWDIRVSKKISFNVGYGASHIFQKLEAFEMYWHAEGMKTVYDGEIRMDGKLYVIDPKSCYGYSDKNWGKGFTNPWLWLSSCSLYSEKLGRKLENSAFDIGGGRPKAFGIDLGRKLLGALYYEGQEYEYNFSKPWTCPRTKFKVSTKGEFIRWKVWQENIDSLIKIDIRCRKSDMLFIKYEDPLGHMGCEKLWNGGNGEGTIRLYSKQDDRLIPIDTLSVTRVGCEWSEY